MTHPLTLQLLLCGCALRAAGIPVRRHFDWSVGGASPGGGLLLMGEPCSERTMEQRAKDAELVDFFQNAPIALHWLSGEGIILWANQTELDVLGYTEEEVGAAGGRTVHHSHQTEAGPHQWFQAPGPGRYDPRTRQNRVDTSGFTQPPSMTRAK